MSYLTDKELDRLKEHLKNHTYQKVADIIEYVQKEFDVYYTDSGMRAILHQLNFVYKKPEKVPFRVDKKAQSDNAGYYKAPEVKWFAENLAIKLIYLPAYSPNLNLMERIWKFYKRKVLYNRYYEEFADMIRASGSLQELMSIVMN